MFKFDFTLQGSGVPDARPFEKIDDVEDDSGLEWTPAKKFLPDYSEIKLPEHWRLLTINQYKLKHILPSGVKLNSSVEESIDALPADIIPAKYEGGLKVWKSTHHLLEFLSQDTPPIDFTNKTVLDLGCGNGLLGIMSLLLGASSAHFQDYNEEVIKAATVPTVIKNLENTNISKTSCSYFYGDWMSFNQLIDEKYDVILTSATIYNTSHYKKLLSVFKNGLKPNGCVIIAAKTYYFGYGGGTRQFEEAIVRDGSFQTELLWISSEGVQQEIIRVTFK